MPTTARRRRCARSFDEILRLPSRHVDVLVSPTTPTVAFPIGERADDPVAMYKADLATLPSSLYGGPALSLPAGLGDHDMPVGLQVMAAVQRDDLVYRVGAALESALQARWDGPLLSLAPSLESSDMTDLMPFDDSHCTVRSGDGT